VDEPVTEEIQRTYAVVSVCRYYAVAEKTSAHIRPSPASRVPRIVRRDIPNPFSAAPFHGPVIVNRSGECEILPDQFLPFSNAVILHVPTCVASS